MRSETKNVEELRAQRFSPLFKYGRGSPSYSGCREYAVERQAPAQGSGVVPLLSEANRRLLHFRSVGGDRGGRHEEPIHRHETGDERKATALKLRFIA